MRERNDKQKEELTLDVFLCVVSWHSGLFLTGSGYTNEDRSSSYSCPDAHIDCWVCILECELAISYMNTLSVSKFCHSPSLKKIERWVIVTAWPIIPSHHHCSLVLLRQSGQCCKSNTNNSSTQVPSMMIVCFFLSVVGTCSHIPQPKHGSNTNKVVGGERVCVCVCICTRSGVCYLVFPAVASAGATGKRDSVCVIEILYKVISEL